MRRSLLTCLKLLCSISRSVDECWTSGKFADQHILPQMFWSSQYGDSLKDILSHMSKDLATQLVAEIRSLHHEPLNTLGNSRVVVECDMEGNWKVGWERVFDKESLGYLVVSEFQDTWEGTVWSEASWALESNEAIKLRTDRFERRMAIKARKELARMGIKEPKRKRIVPGAWVE